MLDDVLVIEVGERLSTGYAGKMLRDAGATVVRVEHDDLSSPDIQDADLAAFIHAGKRSVSPRSWQSLSAELPGLVERADAVICDAPHLRAMAVGLRTERPDLVVVSISDYGLDGPQPPASEFTLQAESGLTAIHPTGDRPPVAAGVPLGEISAGIQAAIGVVAGLVSVEAGADQVDADVSRFESLTSILQFPWVFGQHADHTPYAAPAAAVPGLEKARDGWVCVVCVTPQQWVAFKAITGDPRLDDQRYDQLIDRQDLVAELTPLIRQFTQRHTVAQLMEMGAAARVPIVPVATSLSVVDLPPYAERGSFVTHPDGFTQPRPAFRVAGAAWEPASRPGRGQDDDHDWGTRPVRTWRGGADPQQPLSGVRVVELGSFQAGPLVTRNLAGLGAEVVKIESVTRPDMLRFGGPHAGIPDAWERGASFTGTNWGKRSLTADLKDPQGIDAIRRLIGASDLVLENYSPRVLDGLGLDADGIRALSPDAVVMRLPAWGMTGPWKDLPGFTYSADATCGMSDLTGYPDGDPLLTGTTIDPIAADVSTFVALAGLRRRLLTGDGLFVEVSLCDVAIQLTAAAVIASSRSGEKVERCGNERVGVVPQGMYRSQTGEWVALSVTSDDQWSALSRLMEPLAPTPESTSDVVRRTSNIDVVDGAVRRFVSGQPSRSVVAALHAHGIPAAVMSTGEQAHLHPSVVARNRPVTLTHPVNGDVVHLRPPVQLSSASDGVLRHSPLFGEHNVEVLSELGYSEEEIAQLEAAGKIGISPFGLPTQHQR